MSDPTLSPSAKLRLHLPTRTLGTKLSEISQRISHCGWALATSGNFSSKLESAPDVFLITASGKDKRTLEPTDVVLVDANGDAIVGEAQRPSYETKIHARIYEATGAGAVLHAHPPHLVALSSLVPPGRESIPLVGLELVKAFAGVTDPGVRLELPVVANHQDMEITSRACAAAVKAPVPAIALRGHGVTVWGRDLAEALRHLEAVEGLAQVIILQKTLGRDPWLS